MAEIKCNLGSGSEITSAGHAHLCGHCGQEIERGLFDCEVDRDHDFGLCDACIAAGVNLNQ